MMDADGTSREVVLLGAKPSKGDGLWNGDVKTGPSVSGFGVAAITLKSGGNGLFARLGEMRIGMSWSERELIGMFS